MMSTLGAPGLLL